MVNGLQDQVEQPPSKLTFIRHGESNLNKGRKGFCFADEDERVKALEADGSLANQDSNLTLLGEWQSREVGKKLYKLIGVPSVVYCSPFVRAKQTLKFLMEPWPSDAERPPIIFDIRIRERESAPVSMMIKAEVESRFPWLQWYHDQVGAFYFRYPNGESLADVADGRCRQFIRGLNKHIVGENVLVITHGNFMRCSRFILERWDPERLRAPGSDPVPNCGILRYERRFVGFSRLLQLVAID